jgi:hypothetical protein
MSDQPLSYESVQTSGWTKQEVAVLVVKVLAAYCVLQGLPVVAHLPALMYALIMGGGPVGPGFSALDVMMYIVPYVLYLGVGVILWLLSNTMAGWLLGVPGSGVVQVPPSSELLAAGLAIIGMLLMVWGTIDLAKAGITMSGVAGRLRPLTFYYDESGIGLLLLGSVQLVLGAVLFLRARGLALLWQTIRTGGVHPREA